MNVCAKRHYKEEYIESGSWRWQSAVGVRVPCRGGLGTSQRLRIARAWWLRALGPGRPLSLGASSRLDRGHARSTARDGRWVTCSRSVLLDGQEELELRRELLL